MVTFQSLNGNWKKVEFIWNEVVGSLKCKDCNVCQKGFFKSQPNKYVCVGVKEPFVINDIENYCAEYSEKNKEKLWSWNESDSGTWTHGTFNTKEEAIQDALGCMIFIKKELSTDNPTIYLGQCERIPLRTDPDPYRIMEELDEAYCDDTGCDYYIYDDVTDEQRNWLENKLSDLIKEFHEKIGLNPGWFEVVGMEEINLNDYKGSVLNN